MAARIWHDELNGILETGHREEVHGEAFKQRCVDMARVPENFIEEGNVVRERFLDVL